MAAQDREGSATDTRVGRPRVVAIYGLIAGGALAIVVIVALILIFWPSGSEEPEFTLEVSVAASSEAPAFESDFDCLDPDATSSFPHDVGASRSLLVYPTELVGVRYRLVVPVEVVRDDFNFIGTWSTDDLEIDTTPACVNITNATIGDPQLATSFGTRDGNPAAELTLSQLEPGSIVEIDMMVEVIRLDSAGTLAVDVATNELVEVSGTSRRASIALRDMAVTDATLAASTELSAPGERIVHDVRISNASPDRFAFDLSTRIELPASLAEHEIVESGGFECEVEAANVVCITERIAPESGETIQLSSLVADSAPTTGASGGADCPTVVVSGREVAPDVCVLVIHEYRDGTRRVPSELRLATDLVPTLDVSLETDPERPFALPEQPLTFDYRLTGLDSAGLRDVEIFDPLCDSLLRVTPSPLEDGDELLEFNETWRFRCFQAVPQEGSRRTLAAAARSNGERVEIDRVVDISIVVPSMTVAVDAPPDPVITIINNGTSVLTNPAIAARDCTSISYIDGDEEADLILSSGEAWRFQCTGSAETFYAYALDPAGSVVTAFR